MQEIGDQNLTVALFDRFPVRRTWHNDEWYYSVVDIVAALVDTPSPKRYWSELKGDLKKKEGYDVYAEGALKLRLPAHDGRMLQTDCANRKTLLRLIQSIPSPNADPFKRWLASVGEAVLVEAEEDADTRSLRAQHRWKLHQVDTHLHQIVMYRGITTPEQHERLRDSNYAGLYGIPSREQVARAKGLSTYYGVEPEATMGVMEMAANIFQRAGTAQVVEERNIQGEDAINATAEDVGVQVRLTMERMGVTMPESLPRYRALGTHEWVPQGEPPPGALDWSTPTQMEPDKVIPIYEVVEIDGNVTGADELLPSSVTQKGLRLIGETHISSQDEGEEEGEDETRIEG